jgi:hypothetical protein
MIGRILFMLFGKQLHAFIDSQKLRPKGFDGMKLAYTWQGVKYYTWEDLADFPAIRQKHVERCNRMVDAGIGQKTLDDLCTLIEGHILEAVKTSKQDERNKRLVRATQAVGELRNRPNEVIPEEIAYDLCALFVAREDEDPRLFDATIHTEKIQVLRSAGRAGHDFFTSAPLWRKLYGLSLTTEAAFDKLLMSWTLARIRKKAVLQMHESKQ